MKHLFALLLFVLTKTVVLGQGTGISFIDFQKRFPRANDAFQHKADTLEKQFRTKGLEWPVKYLYIRAFKYEGKLEVWAKNERKDTFKLFKTYKICAVAGSLGPKRMEGDYQVPEGFYYINQFKSNSNYYLSLGINYPNPSDKVLSDSLRPGGGIFIHGSCVTVGCLPLTDPLMEEVYTLAAFARNSGQDYIPVHIFPIRFDDKKSAAFLANLTKDDNELKTFSKVLEGVYDHFEITHTLPVVMVDSYGNYVFDGLSKKVPPPPKPKRVPVPHRHRTITNLADVVHQWPQFPGGGESFLKYLTNLGKTMTSSLPEGVKKAFVQVEFIVDTDGTPTNFKVIKGVDEDFNDELITVMEKMPNWQPALLNDKPVAKLMRQNFAIE